MTKINTTLNIILILIFLSSTFPAFALEEQVTDSKNIENTEDKINDIGNILFEHSGNSTVQFYHGLTIAIIALIISLTITGLSASQSRKNTKETQDFITKSRYLQDANNYFNKKDYKNAKTYFDLYLKFQPNDIKKLLNAGAASQQLGEFDDALKYYEKILEIESENTSAFNNIGLCYSFKRDFPKALEFYEKSLMINPNKGNTLNNIGALYFRQLTKTYDVNLRIANFEKAISYFDKIIDNKLFSGKDLIGILLNKANALSQLGETSDSIRICNQVLDRDSSNIDALLIKGTSLIRGKIYRQALICYGLVLKKDPLNDDAILNKGNCHLELEEYQDAIKYYNEFIIKNQNNPLGFINTGNIFLKLKKYPEAITQYEIAEKLDPKNMKLLLNLASSYLSSNDPKSAKKYLLRAFNENPNDIDVISSLGACLIALNNLPSSLYYLHHGFKLNPSYMPLLKNLEVLLGILKVKDMILLTKEIQKLSK